MKTKLKEYLVASASILIIDLLCWTFSPVISYQSVSLILIFNISLLSLFVKTDVLLFSAFVSSLSWNYFFIPPLFTVLIDKLEDILMFTAYFIIAIITGILNSKIRENESLALEQERKTQILYEHTRKLAKAINKQEVIDISVENLKDSFNIDSNIYIIEDSTINQTNINAKDHAIIAWVFDNQQKAGKFTDILQDAGKNLYYPLFTKIMKIGVIEIRNEFELEDKKELFEAFCYQIASALEREILNDKAQKAILINESERLYSTLFNSISHELKIPISALKAASESLKDKNIIQDEAIKEILVDEIITATERLNNLVSNLLDMSRLESGLIKPNLEWHDISDLLNQVAKNLKAELKGKKIKIQISEDVSIVKLDFGLIEQAIFNIVHNALTYNTDTVQISILVDTQENYLRIIIEDNGKGIDQTKINRIFDKFYRVDNNITGGSGLGLSIVKGFIEAHQGTIEAENIYSNSSINGLRFIVKLPILK